MSTKKIQELEKYPKFKENYIKAFDRMLKKRKADGKKDYSWKDAESVYKWWVEDTSIPGQMTFEDYEDEE